MKEQFLEPFLRSMRLNQVLPFIKSYPNCHLLDIGCGWDAKLLRSIESYIQKGVGIDFKAPLINEPKIETIEANLKSTLPFPDKSFDLITLLAVLEHLDDDFSILKESARVLKPGGGIVVTVPSWDAKPILEFLSYRMGIVNPDEIRDHKRYYSYSDMVNQITKIPELKIESHSFFQWKFNNLFFIKKI